tara:strand:+ start:68 stop:628 length:561 start_codon:yes stop_codon:yes gene_type:complete
MAQNRLIINIIISFVYSFLLLEKYINHSFKTVVTYFLHTVMMFLMFYLNFVLFTSTDDNEIFEHTVLDDQISRVNIELEENTDIKITGTFPKNEYPTNKSIKNTQDYIIAVCTFIAIALVFYLVHRKYNVVHYRKLRYNIIPVIILGLIEYLFTSFIGQEMIFETAFTDVTSIYLDNILKYSNFVP